MREKNDPPNSEWCGEWHEHGPLCIPWNECDKPPFDVVDNTKNRRIIWDAIQFLFDLEHAPYT